MSAKIYYIADLHFGHANILSFSPEYRGGSNIDEHDEWLIQQWNSVVRKRDSVYVLGDVAFSREGLAKCGRLAGDKKLIMGNHDKYPAASYLDYFRGLSGVMKHRGFWLSHAPIHPEELRGIRNIHGHVHSKTIDDHRYINVSVEAVGGLPLCLDEILERQ